MMAEGSPDTNLDAQQRFVYDLLGALDRRRSAVDTRCAVVFAMTGLSLGLFVNLTKTDAPLDPSSAVWAQCLYSRILTTLMLALLFGLSLIAPISRPRKVRKADAGKPSLSWFYRIADMEIAAYAKLVTQQTSATLLEETSDQVVRISRLLKRRYDRLQRTCYVLALSVVLFLVYGLLMFVL